MMDAHESGVPARVLLVYPHTLVRSGLAAELAATADIEVVGDCADAESALERAVTTRPDVVVTDFLLPGMDGCELAERLGCGDRATGVVVLLDWARPPLVNRALRSGAASVIDKHSGPGHLGQAVRAARAASAYLCPLSSAVFTPDVPQAFGGPYRNPAGA